MGEMSRLEALAIRGMEFDQAQAEAEEQAAVAELAIVKAEQTLPQVFVRLHGPQPAGKRIVQLPPWYPGEWLIPRLRHPVRTLLGLFLLPRQAWSLVRSLTGGLVREEAYQARNEACAVCPARQVWITGRGEKHYCGACGCARWWLARLQVKNRLRKWACPLRRWDAKAGPYPDADLRVRLLESGYATEDDLRPVGGCGGCGGSNGSAKRMDKAAVAELGG